MSSTLINTSPQQKFLYTVKRYEAKTFHLPFHRHERYELTYIIKGKGTRIIGDSIMEYEDGDIVLMSPNTAHQWQSARIQESLVSAITVFFSEDFPSKDFKLLPEFNRIAKLLEMSKFGIELKGTLKKEIAAKISELEADYSIEQMMKIMSILNSIATSEEFNILMSQGFLVTKNHDWNRISEIVTYIQNHISEKITIDDLANIVFMHPGSVNRFFKQATGFTLIEYINLMRIGMACELLSNTDKKTSDIAYECGFNNLSHFNRIFKRVKGATPKGYRMQLF